MPRPSPLNWLPDAAMTLDQAVDRANALLSAATSAQMDGRVRPTLDARTMRYYQTLGIVPPPRRAGGRRAVYRSTHLVRAVTTKLLQSGGARLGEIARHLRERSDHDLWQQVGDLLQSGSADATRVVGRQSAPANLDAPHRVSPGRSGTAPESATAQRAPSAETDPAQPHAVTIMPGVHLLVEPTASDDPDELLDAMRAYLARRGRSWRKRDPYSAHHD